MTQKINIFSLKNAANNDEITTRLRLKQAENRTCDINMDERIKVSKNNT